MPAATEAVGEGLEGRRRVAGTERVRVKVRAEGAVGTAVLNVEVVEEVERLLDLVLLAFQQLVKHDLWRR